MIVASREGMKMPRMRPMRWHQQSFRSEAHDAEEDEDCRVLIHSINTYPM